MSPSCSIASTSKTYTAIAASFSERRVLLENRPLEVKRPGACDIRVPLAHLFPNIHSSIRAWEWDLTQRSTLWIFANPKRGRERGKCF